MAAGPHRHGDPSPDDGNRTILRSAIAYRVASFQIPPVQFASIFRPVSLRSRRSARRSRLAPLPTPRRSSTAALVRCRHLRQSQLPHVHRRRGDGCAGAISGDVPPCRDGTRSARRGFLFFNAAPTNNASCELPDGAAGSVCGMFTFAQIQLVSVPRPATSRCSVSGLAWHSVRPRRRRLNRTASGAIKGRLCDLRRRSRRPGAAVHPRFACRCYCAVGIVRKKRARPARCCVLRTVRMCK